MPIIYIWIVDKDAYGREIIRATESDSMAYMSTDYPHIISIISKVSLVKSNEQAMRAIMHELRHIYDFTKSENIKLANASKDKILEFTSEMRARINSAKNATNANHSITVWTNLREYYAIFFRALQYEGIAMYVEHNPPFMHKQYMHLLKLAKNNAKSLAHNWLEREELLRFMDNYEKFPIFNLARYYIGMFMVYCLLYHHEKNLNEIAQMPYMSFIQIYERLAIKLGGPVLVSVASGRGILDYKRLLKESRNALLIS